jgi:putative SOS response-associated peptidase YedK
MPVILTEPTEWDLWMSEAPWPNVKGLQRPLPDGDLKVVSVGPREDGAADMGKPGLFETD